MTDQELMDMAKKAAEYAYVPYSKFPVGAALEVQRRHDLHPAGNA